jgi:flagellar basal body rod protein FlgG
MINPATADALARIRRIQEDLGHAYEPGFEPQSAEFAAAQTPLPERDPLSTAAPEGAYFIVGSVQSPMYSRDGSFTIADGMLTTKNGLPVLGVPAGGGPLAPVRVDEVDRALARVRDPQIGADGKLTYSRTTVDPRSGERRMQRIEAGTLALAKFPAGTLPVRVDGARVQAPRGIAPHVGLPGDGNFGGLATSSRDVGRVDFIAGLAKLQEAYQLLGAIGASGKARGGLEKTTMDLLK